MTYKHTRVMCQVFFFFYRKGNKIKNFGDLCSKGHVSTIRELVRKADAWAPAWVY